ncbi:hypothetical protein AB0N05_37840 [Nocardia sp. NPDC051030]|uniref:hypothetical protein n=1 Tax=Nocardia sp. NPDC051030 TaxID=3155162 RepID=UPI0034192B85
MTVDLSLVDQSLILVVVGGMLAMIGSLIRAGNGDHDSIAGGCSVIALVLLPLGVWLSFQ